MNENNSATWIFGLLILLGIMNGGFMGNNAAALGYENLATSNEVQRGFSDQNIQAQTRDILGAVTNGTAQIIAAGNGNSMNEINAIKDGNAALIREFGTVETALTALSGKQQECCCEILRAVDGVNYNAAMNTAAIQKTIVEEAQKNRDLMTGNRMADMQNQINQLQLAQAVSGVVRYPMQTTYSSGANPFCGCGCGGYGNI